MRYILEGSVRKLGQKVRIGAKLISADRENTIWSHNFDFTIDEMFDIQDELVETIVSTIVGHVDDEEVKQLVRVKPENHTAYDLVLQGLEYHRKSNVTLENAKKLLNSSIKLLKLILTAHGPMPGGPVPYQITLAGAQTSMAKTGLINVLIL